MNPKTVIRTKRSDGAALPVSRDGRSRVLSYTWDSNGSFRVIVADKTPEGREPSDRDKRRVRDLARRVDRMGKIKWTRIDEIFKDPQPDGSLEHTYTITASRLDPMYR